VRKWPLRLPDEEPPVEEFTPVFIEAWSDAESMDDFMSQTKAIHTEI
jgi:hypothetical protein